ncbi:MAG: hypothetical protein DMF58_14995 [Acidobacteria bacterium]|nr:MAG: hypothetical protein DMF58_14995 [Acidobacteriota bacterium]
MRRSAIALAVIAGTIVPAFIATVWLFGCCVLPFHHAIHRLLPLTAPKAKQPPSIRFVTELTSAFGVHLVRRSSPLLADSPAAYRSFITLGAIRCDRDVGLHMLFATFLI